MMRTMRLQAKVLAQLLAWIAVTLVASRPAGAVVTGSIFGPGSQTFAVAVTPLVPPDGGAANAFGMEFARVLSRDLELSGYFRVLDPRTFIAGLRRHGGRHRLRRLGGDRRAGDRAGHHRGIGDTVTVEARLFDVPGAARSGEVGRRLRGRGRTCRAWPNARRSSLELLTGERGPFDSKIALVSTRGGRAEGHLPLDVRPATRRCAHATSDRSSCRRAGGRTRAPSSSRRTARISRGSSRSTSATGAVTPFRPGAPSMLGGAWSPDGSRVAGDARAGRQHRHRAARPPAARVRDGSPTTGASTCRRPGRPTAGASRSARTRSGAPQIYVMNARRLRRHARVAVGQLQHVAGVVAEGRPARVDDARGRRLPDRRRRADGSGARTITVAGQQRESVVGARRSLPRLLVARAAAARTSASPIATERPCKQLTPGPGDDTSPAWSPRL